MKEKFGRAGFLGGAAGAERRIRGIRYFLIYTKRLSSISSFGNITFKTKFDQQNGN